MCQFSYMYSKILIKVVVVLIIFAKYVLRTYLEYTMCLFLAPNARIRVLSIQYSKKGHSDVKNAAVVFG